MGRYIAIRLALGLVTLISVTVLVFVATNLLPGDAATEILGRGATPETLARFREQLGLDDPLVLRYGKWLWDLLHGDLGQSLTTQTPIAATIWPSSSEPAASTFASAARWSPSRCARAG